MELEDIYESLKKESIGKSRFFRRELLVVPAPVFDEYRPYFLEAVDVFNKKANYRTTGTFKHIHAVQTGKLVELHYDFGNLNKSFIMAVPHFFLDVIPYLLWHLITFTKLYKIDTRSLPPEYRDKAR